MTLTGANYDEAIEILRKRFGNIQLIINKHMEQLLNTDGVTSQHDVKGLRHSLVPSPSQLFNVSRRKAAA